MSTNKSQDLVDQELIRQLADLLTETELTEIEIEKEGVRLKIARQGQTYATALPAAAPPVAAVTVAEPAVVEPSDATSIENHPGLVRSPMVGTVYLAPRPEAQSFVQAGDTVVEGQTLLIIEAMKVMNNIAAPKSGRIAKVLVQNEQPIEYGEPLIIIE